MRQLQRQRSVPGNPQSLLQKARGALGAGDAGSALKHLDRLLAAAPRHLEALNDRGAILGGMGRLEEALACFDRALAVRPDLVDALNNRGLVLGMLGRHAEALASLDRAAARAPQRLDVLCNRGYSLVELGCHAEAVDCLGAALAIDPHHFGALNNRGRALSALGRHREAEADFAAVLAVRPGDFNALLNRGAALNELRRPDQALACLDHALALRPRQPEALNARGGALLQLDREDEALTCFDQVLAEFPDHFGVLGNRAIVLGRMGCYDEALACVEKAAALKPDDFGSHLNRAIALSQLHRYEAALASVDRALALRPDHVAALNNRASNLLRLNRPEEALVSIDRAVALDPAHIEARNTRGATFWNMDRAEAARACFEGILAEQPDHVSAINNLSFIDLAAGDLPSGFRGQEIRWRTSLLKNTRLNTAAPLWLGETPLQGKTIVISHEQGFGDMLQFVRYLPRVTQQAGRVVLAVPSALRSVLQTLPARFDTVVEGEPMPPHDCYCPIMSLPLVFGTTLDTIPADVPYLSAQPTRAAQWGERLGPARRPRIGLVWAGRQTPPLNMPRDMRLQQLLSLLDLDADFISLQKEIPAEDRTLLNGLTRIVRHGESLGDFADTAALIANLDLLISVDTAVVHLAGAMGKPVWLMNRHASCWRWLRGREDSPWYPSLRQFRQPSFGDWAGVVEQVRGAAAQFVAQWHGRQAPPPEAPLDDLMRQGLEAAGRADYEAALGCFTEVLRRAPEHVEALRNLGATLGMTGYNDEALVCFDRGLALQPDHPGLLCNRGLLLGRLDRFIEAQACFERALALDPRRPDALNGRGLALGNLDRHEESLACFEQALQLNPHEPGALLNRGLALGKLHRVEEALACFSRLLAEQPDSVEALLNRGIMLDKLNRRDEALACYEQVLQLEPGHAEARCNRSLILLGCGRLAEGFREYESRWDTAQLRGVLQPTAPLWLGQTPLEGRTILLQHEQGYGDALQFARYLPLVARRAKRVILGTRPELRGLMRTLAGGAEIIVDGDPVPAHDLQCPLLSLPLAFGTALDSIPATIPYLAAEAERAAEWGRRLGAAPRLRIGLVWAGRREPPLNRPRDMALELLLPLLRLEADFISLQKEVPPDDLALLADLPQLRRYGEALRDFADTAALIQNLDLVIAVDTAVVHLAGAMGKPVWLMNRHASCWRWLRARSDSPWYPAMRLFRQNLLDDWSGVVAEVGEALSLLLQRRGLAA